MLSKRQRQARLQQLFIHSDSLWVSLGSGYVNFSEGPTRSHERIPKEPNFVLRCELMMWLMWPSFVWSERLLARHESQDHAVAWIQDAAAQKPKTTAKLQRDQYEVYLTHLEFSTWKAAFLDLLALSLTDTWTCTWAEVQANVPTAKSDTSNFQHRPQITPLLLSNLSTISVPCFGGYHGLARSMSAFHKNFEAEEPTLKAVSSPVIYIKFICSCYIRIPWLPVTWFGFVACQFQQDPFCQLVRHRQRGTVPLCVCIDYIVFRHVLTSEGLLEVIALTCCSKFEVQRLQTCRKPGGKDCQERLRHGIKSIKTCHSDKKWNLKPWFMGDPHPETLFRHILT